MIDFVYSMFKGFWDDFIVYDGLDRGYVFGLENFISIMEQMWDENQQVLFWVFRIFFFVFVGRDYCFEFVVRIYRFDFKGLYFFLV